MPNCPNCGRLTQRTKDWVCQWCGYPLLSKSFRPLQQTYKELKEEREVERGMPLEEVEAPVLEAEAEAVAEPEPIVSALPETVVELAPMVEPEVTPEPESVAEAEPEPVAEPEPEPEPVAETKSKLQRKRTLRSKARPVPEPEPEPVVEPEPVAETEPVMETESVIEVEPEPESEEPEPAETETELQSGLIEVGIEGLYAAFAKDRDGTEARYRNKMLKITGLLYRTVINENLDVAYIILTSAKKYGEWKVSCTFGKDHEKELRQLAPEQMVTVQGNYDGYRVNVQMRDCVLVR